MYIHTELNLIHGILSALPNLESALRLMHLQVLAPEGGKPLTQITLYTPKPSDAYTTSLHAFEILYIMHEFLVHRVS